MAAKSIEEQVEDLAKEQLKKFGVRYFTKNESLNEEIDGALKKADSKSGGGEAEIFRISKSFWRCRIAAIFPW